MEQSNLKELRAKLVKARFRQVVGDVDSGKVHKIRALRKDIARELTKQNAKKQEEGQANES